MRTLRWAVVILAGILMVLAGACAVPDRVVVMHGFIGSEQALLWTQTKRAARITVEYRQEGRDDVTKAVAAARVQDDFVAHLKLDHLLPAKTYSYIVLLDDARVPAASGQFRTQAAALDDGSEIRIALGSCAYLSDGRFGTPALTGKGGFEIFDAIAAKKPHMMLWLGDNIYMRPYGMQVTAVGAEWLSLETMSRRYRAYRDFAPLHAFLTSTSHVAIWDDHDFWYVKSGGASETDPRAPAHTSSALLAFKRYWANPEYGAPGVPGIFGRITLGDVELFLLDNRTYRTPQAELPKAGAAMFGPAQMRWLKDALKGSRARFKVIAGGTQFWNSRNPYEAFHDYPEEQRELRDFLTTEHIDGVVFVSGDRHFSQLLKLPRAGAYPIFELTSSPLVEAVFANPPELKLPFLDNEEILRDPKRGVPTVSTKRNFGMLRIYGPQDSRALVFETYDATGNLEWSFEVAADELR
jgi:alkaline phosphatase D